MYLKAETLTLEKKKKVKMVHVGPKPKIQLRYQNLELKFTSRKFLHKDYTNYTLSGKLPQWVIKKFVFNKKLNDHSHFWYLHDIVFKIKSQKNSFKWGY